MPRGKAPIRGAIGWPRKLPPSVGDPQLLLKWKRSDHPKPPPEELFRLCKQASEALGRYFGFQASTPLLTETKRGTQLRKGKRGDLSPLDLDVNTRAIYTPVESRAADVGPTPCSLI